MERDSRDCQTGRLIPTLLLLSLSLLACSGCRRGVLRVAMIPRTTASPTWEAVHSGAQAANAGPGIQVYWNAPSSEDDVLQQAALIDRVVERQYEALIVAPDQPLALAAAIQRAVHKGLKTIVIGSPMLLSPRPNLAYIVNDDEAAGRMAASRISRILQGKGKIAVLGVNPESLSELSVLHSFEATLEQHSPGIAIVDRRVGTHLQGEAQEIAYEVMSAHPDLDAVFSFSAVTSRGTLIALESRTAQQGTTPAKAVRLVGFEQSPELVGEVRAGTIDSLVAEDRYDMGYRAMELVSANRTQVMPYQNIELQPTLLTRDNIDSPQMSHLTKMEWGVAP